MEDKKKATILVCTDGPSVTTGFGKVCFNLITRWLATGKYRIVVMATNDRGEYHPIKHSSPDLIVEPLPYMAEDPYGLHRMPDLLRKYNPDLVFSLNDIWVWTGDERTPQMENWFYKHLKGFKPYIPWIGYFPVDGRLWDPKWVELLNNMTEAACFTDYGLKTLKETPGVDLSKLHVIYHGHDTQNFFPLSKEEKIAQRKLMGVPEDGFLIGVIARNQPRKQIPMVIYAFKLFRDGYVVCDKCGCYRNLEIMKDCEICGSYGYTDGKPGILNSYLYLHMNMLDMRGYRLPKIQRDNRIQNVISRNEFDVANGVPVEELNRIFNACDVTVNPAAAGGYELAVAESMAAGVPVIATRSTSMTELLDDGKGWLVLPATYMIMDDAAHTPKHIISINGLVDAMHDIYANPEKAKAAIEKALPFSHERNWDRSAKQFEELIDKSLNSRIFITDFLKENKQNVVFLSEINNFASTLSTLPAMTELAKTNKGINLVYATKKRNLPLTSGLTDFTTIDFDRMWFNDSEMGKFKPQISSVDAVCLKNEAAAIALGVGNMESYIEAYARFGRVEVDYNNISKYLNIPEECVANAKKILDDENNGKFKVCLILNTDNYNYGIPIDGWQKLITFLRKIKDVSIIGIGNPFELEKLNVDISVSGTSLVNIFAIMKECNCIVTNIEEYIHTANYFKVPYIILQGPRKYEHITKHHRCLTKSGKNQIYYISKQQQYPCMPCWKELGAPCGPSGTPIAHCMQQISMGEAFMKIANIRDNWLSNK